MNENGRNKREWVKTAAIIFLTVMLILTFFSNTIMNYSLPEVATQYVQSGTITAKIRGSGIVESGDPYNVEVKESRKVSEVAVKTGMEVQKGDILIYLEDAESDELKAAIEALQAAKDTYDTALLNSEITAADILAANNHISTETYRQRLTSAQNAVTAAENEQKESKRRVEELEKKKKAQSDDLRDNPNLTDAEKAFNLAYDKLEAAEIALRQAENTLTQKRNLVDAIERQIELDSSVSGNDTSGLNAQLAEARKQVAAAQTQYNTAKEDVSGWELEHEIREEALKKERGITDTALENELEAAEADLALKEAALAEKQEAVTELAGQITRSRQLEKLQTDIAKAQELVDDLTKESIGATITAPISGTVTTINVKAGESTSVSTPVVVMQPEGKGYTMSFTVSNEQAKRLSVGDQADLVNAWRYDDVTVTLSSIKPDPNNPGQNKLLTFDVAGEITPGQSLSVSVGQKSASYDYIVPNSAIREDSNGKFILIVESKSSPLGTRYVASRVDVEVLASDDNQSAVSGALYGYEYVITTSTKPVEAGKLIRMTNN